MIIYIIICKNIQKIIIEYAISLQKNIKNSKIILYPDNEVNIINPNNIYIFFGLAYVNYPITYAKNIYYVNLEQLTIDGSHSQYNFLQPIIDIYKNKNINLLDYSEGNISILKNYNIQSLYLPYQVNYDEIYNYEKIYTFAICCALNVRKQHIYDNIQNKYTNCYLIGNPPLWGETRDNILFKSKVLANIHHREYDYNILEEIRITRCILNKIIIISEYSLEYEKYPLKNYVIFVDYHNMINKIIDVIDNYEKYYNELYNNFDINIIDNQLKEYLKFLNV
jgi:hypothetical protein